MSGHSSYVPKTGIERWLDARLPIIRLERQEGGARLRYANLAFGYTLDIRAVASGTAGEGA